MNAIADTITTRLSPSATEMLRTDHAKVLAASHRYKISDSPGKKLAVVNTVCLALEVHAQLEEEIFYPAVRAVHPAVVEKSVPEHEEMRTLIATLRGMEPTSEEYDRTFMALMRSVIHHVADEETTLLPDAERLLGDEIGELGARMTKRRLQLMAPRLGEITRNSVRTFPAAPMLLAAGAVLAGAYLFRRNSGSGS
ncbi:MAG TPA: hemerythrin domain-containing protein [Burkholderiales bacterium]|nr:hemerythrin domain-containing protein [Burkholderiales bacterium]